MDSVKTLNQKSEFESKAAVIQTKDDVSGSDK